MRGRVVEVVPGPGLLPFIAEYCSFVWLHDDSDGDAASRVDRKWAWRWHSDRRGDERFEVLGPRESGRADGVFVAEMATKISDLEQRLRLADHVHERVLAEV